MPERAAFPPVVGLLLVVFGVALILLTSAHFLLREDDFDLESSGRFEFEEDPATEEDPLLDPEEIGPPPTWREMLEREEREMLSAEALRARIEGRDYRHRLREGESLRQLARRYLGSEDELPRLREANPQLLGQDRIEPGDEIVIPYSGR